LGKKIGERKEIKTPQKTPGPRTCPKSQRGNPLNGQINGAKKGSVPGKFGPPPQVFKEKINPEKEKKGAPKKKGPSLNSGKVKGPSKF